MGLWIGQVLRAAQSCERSTENFFLTMTTRMMAMMMAIMMAMMMAMMMVMMMAMMIAIRRS